MSGGGHVPPRSGVAVAAAAAGGGGMMAAVMTGFAAGAAAGVGPGGAAAASGRFAAVEGAAGAGGEVLAIGCVAGCAAAGAAASKARESLNAGVAGAGLAGAAELCRLSGADVRSSRLLPDKNQIRAQTTASPSSRRQVQAALNRVFRGKLARLFPPPSLVMPRTPGMHMKSPADRRTDDQLPGQYAAVRGARERGAGVQLRVRVTYAGRGAGHRNPFRPKCRSNVCSSFVRRNPDYTAGHRDAHSLLCLAPTGLTRC